MDLQMIVEKGLFDLLHRIAGDYELDYDELCERYMSAPGPKSSRGSTRSSVSRTSSPPPLCGGKTAKGQPCKKKAADGCDGFCKTHVPKSDTDVEDDVPVNCRSKTAKGQPCKKKAADGCDGYCKTHVPKVDLESESEADDEPDICRGMTGKKQPCKKKAADGCDGFCKTHKDSGPFKLPPLTVTRRVLLMRIVMRAAHMVTLLTPLRRSASLLLCAGASASSRRLRL